jgi:hypothetical protein
MLIGFSSIFGPGTIKMLIMVDAPVGFFYMMFVPFLACSLYIPVSVAQVFAAKRLFVSKKQRKRYLSTAEQEAITNDRNSKPPVHRLGNIGKKRWLLLLFALAWIAYAIICPIRTAFATDFHNAVVLMIAVGEKWNIPL